MNAVGGRLCLLALLCFFALPCGRSEVLFRREAMGAARAENDGPGSLEPSNLSLFCFAWTRSSEKELAILPEVRLQFARCDGHRIVVDREARGLDGGADLLQVAVPSQRHAPPTRRSRWDEHWLYHRNMAALLPAWGHLIEAGVLDKHDWVIQTEFDHVVRPSKVRLAIVEYLKSLSVGDEKERAAVGGPMMLKFGNAFAFNAQMVKEMRRQWHRLGKVMEEEWHASGCPHWLEMGWAPDDCPQDDTYPMMANVMEPHVPQFGASGCGQVVRNGQGELILPGGLACYQMDASPAGGNGAEDVQLETIRGIARAATNGVAVHQPGQGPFWPHIHIPIIHDVKHASVHALARQLLGL